MLFRSGEGRRHLASASDTAFIQFSSGSTSTPKGVVLTHANLLVNARGATEAAAFSESDRPLSWMPLTHDMGLIGMVLMMMANGMEIHLMPTDLFIRRPLRWLEVASERRCTLLASPNFGYRHLLRALETRILTAREERDALESRLWEALQEELQGSLPAFRDAAAGRWSRASKARTPSS